MLKAIKRWYVGTPVRLHPEEPDTIGGLHVAHEYTTLNNKSGHFGARWPQVEITPDALSHDSLYQIVGCVISTAHQRYPLPRR